MTDTSAPADNPHMWIAYHGPEPYDLTTEDFAALEAEVSVNLKA